MSQIGTKAIALAIALLIVGSAVGYGLGYMMAPEKIKEVEKRVEVPVEKRVEVPVPALSGEIPIGYILAGSATRDAMVPAEIAIEEVNSYTKQIGLNVTFKLYPEEAQNSPTTALEKFQGMAARGIKAIVGPNWSGMCKAILPYANEHKIVVVSDGSTSPLLAYPDRGYLFRLPVTDDTQNIALSGVMSAIGIKAIVVVQRADAWGDGNYEYIKKHFEARGGVVVDRIRYDGEKTEFSAEVRALADAVTSATQQYGEGHVAVAAWMFDEHVVIFRAVADYPILMKAIWFGSDGYGRSTRLIQELPDVAGNMTYVTMVLGVTESSKWFSFAQNYMNQTGGLIPISYTAFIYDGVWLIAKAVLEAGTYDGEAIKNAIPTVADQYFGPAGWSKLNDIGDKAGGSFELWSTVVENGTVVWRRSGMWDSTTEKVTWYIKVV